MGSRFDLPFSPDSRLRCSSASVRILPPARTFQGAKAIPAHAELVNELADTRQQAVVFTFHLCQQQDLALEVPLKNAPSTLVDYERGFSSESGVRVRL